MSIFLGPSEATYNLLGFISLILSNTLNVKFGIVKSEKQNWNSEIITIHD